MVKLNVTVSQPLVFLVMVDDEGNNKAVFVLVDKGLVSTSPLAFKAKIVGGGTVVDLEKQACSVLAKALFASDRETSKLN